MDRKVGGEGGQMDIIPKKTNARLVPSGSITQFRIKGKAL